MREKREKRFIDYLIVCKKRKKNWQQNHSLNTYFEGIMNSCRHSKVYSDTKKKLHKSTYTLEYLNFHSKRGNISKPNFVFKFIKWRMPFFSLHKCLYYKVCRNVVVCQQKSWYWANSFKTICDCWVCVTWQ